MKLTEIIQQQETIEKEIEVFLTSLDEQDLTEAEQLQLIEGYYKALQTNTEQLTQQANAWCWVISKLLKQKDYYREQAARFSKMASATENKAIAMKKYLQYTVEQNGGRLECADFKLATRATTAPVVIDCNYVGQIPPEYFKEVKLEDRLDKRYIKQALTDGYDLPFAKLGEKGTALFGVK
jgi:Siphovirus Gp157